MNATHVHLLVNHVSILGSIFATFILLYGVLVRSRHTKVAAYVLLVVAAVAGAVTFATGEDAEEAVEHLAGISKNAIHTHEEAAETAIIVVSAVGLLALVGLYIEWKKKTLIKTISIVVLIAALISATLLARVGLLGGQIRHTEIFSAATTAGMPQNETDITVHN